MTCPLGRGQGHRVGCIARDGWSALDLDGLCLGCEATPGVLLAEFLGAKRAAVSVTDCTRCEADYLKRLIAQLT